ncbi:MAG: DUF2142 domain-containing protein [Bryobacteraceae bacterium]
MPSSSRGNTASARAFPPWLTTAILLFLARGTFYCFLQPLWEGYDEWAHVAFIHAIATTGHLPARADPIPSEIADSLAATPEPYSAEPPPQSLTRDQFWRLTDAERADRLQHPPRGGSLFQYEAQQPPLYYVLLALPYRVVWGLPVSARVLFLRLLSLALAALVLPLAWRIALGVFPTDAGARSAVLLLVAMPGLFVDLARVANDSLAIVCCAAVIFCAQQAAGACTLRPWLWLGAALGAALLAKAYALALVPMLPLAAAIAWIRRPSSRHTTRQGSLAAFAVAMLIAGWWYLQTWWITGSLSGEQLQAAAAGIPFAQKWSALFALPWRSVIDSAAYTHIWLSGWSFLSLRSWMYRVFEAAALLAAIGIILRARRILRTGKVLGTGRIFLASSACLLLAIGLLFHSFEIFLAKGIAAGIGWYFYAIAAAEPAVALAGYAAIFGPRAASRAIANVALLFLALDLYTVHLIQAPYYAGLTAHATTGSIRAFHWSDLAQAGGLTSIVPRLAAFSPSGPSPLALALSWTAYAAATIILGIMLFRRTGK